MIIVVVLIVVVVLQTNRNAYLILDLRPFLTSVWKTRSYRLESYEQSSTNTTHDSSKDRGSGRGRGGVHRSVRNNENNDSQAWMNLSQQCKIVDNKKKQEN